VVVELLELLQVVLVEMEAMELILLYQGVTLLQSLQLVEVEVVVAQHLD
tara:strand:- start:561 stop:707 length:147 start_codon:yes stop_codon:yes gene_type:complete